MCQYLEEKGYTLVSLEPGFGDSNSGQLLQVDGIFRRFSIVYNLMNYNYFR